MTLTNEELHELERLETAVEKLRVVAISEKTSLHALLEATSSVAMHSELFSQMMRIKAHEQTLKGNG